MANVQKIVLLLSTFFISTFAKNITCGENEDLDDCPRHCPSDYCPKNELQDLIACPAPKECPPAKCKCRFNYRRADNGTCIPTTSCPPFECSQHEVYNPCPALCPTDSCADAPLHGVCPFHILILLYCNPKCQCKENYCRKNGICVPYIEKPQTQTVLQDEEIERKMNIFYL